MHTISSPLMLDDLNPQNMAVVRPLLFAQHSSRSKSKPYSASQGSQRSINILRQYLQRACFVRLALADDGGLTETQDHE